MYFDVVLDGRLDPIFQGNRANTVRWIKDNPSCYDDQMVTVSVGETLDQLPIKEYLDKYGETVS